MAENGGKWRKVAGLLLALALWGVVERRENRLKRTGERWPGE
jgi:hypothetical protein